MQVKKGTFSVVIVPHDLEKTRTYRIPYGLFYTFIVLAAVGAVAMVIFVMTYGKLLIRARETVMLERQVTELTQRNEQIGEIMRNLAKIRNMDSQIRGMLGLNAENGDSTALRAVHAGETYSDPAHENEQAQVMRSLPSFWPVRGYMTRGFNIAGGREDSQYHPGIDIGVDRGTPVRSAASGYVTEAAWDDTYGYYIRIDHGYGIKTLYAHNDRLVVMKGERVGRGQTIAYSGNTGKSSAPHLHFEVTQNNNPVDPLTYLLQ
jgi:murein DD-endopeptidase MepM/ murein hydrolase activator NlpD